MCSIGCPKPRSTPSESAATSSAKRTRARSVPTATVIRDYPTRPALKTKRTPRDAARARFQPRRCKRSSGGTDGAHRAESRDVARRRDQAHRDVTQRHRQHRTAGQAPGITLGIRTPVRLPIARLRPPHRSTPARPARRSRNPLTGEGPVDRSRRRRLTGPRAGSRTRAPRCPASTAERASRRRPAASPRHRKFARGLRFPWSSSTNVPDPRGKRSSQKGSLTGGRRWR